MATARPATQHKGFDKKDVVKIPSCVNDFIKKHAEGNFISKLAYQSGVDVEHNGSDLVISGTSEKIKQFKRNFKDAYAKDVITLDIQPSLFKDHEDQLSEIADSCKCCIQAKLAEDKEPCFEDVARFKDIKVKVEIASLVDQKEDVLVNTVHSSLELKKGSLSQQILQKAGNEIQTYCSRKYPDGIEAGDIAVTMPGNLKRNGVKWIFHCALPAFKKSTFVKNIKSIMRKCLCEMDKKRVETVAFPALGTGKLGYPIRETAKAMFDAVDEHRKSAIKSSVKKVVFVLHQDDKNTCEVFCDEEVRQKSKQNDKNQKQGFPMIFTDVGVAEGKVRLNIAKESDLRYFSSTVIVVDFKFTKGQCRKKPEMKPSSKEPKSWNDHLKVFCYNRKDISTLLFAVPNVMEFCMENKIFSILIPTCKEFIQTAVEQINVISQEVREYVKDNKDICLQNVFISVPDSDSLDDIEKQLNSGKGSVRDSSLDGDRWRLAVNESLVDFIVVGETLDSTRQAADKLQDYVYSLESQKNIMESSGAIPKSSKPTLNSTEAISKGTVAQELPLVRSEMLPQNQAEHKWDTNDVSAEINPGIILYLKQQNMLELWKKEMQNTYCLEFLQKDSGVVVAKGSFKDIISFEQHLENKCMNIGNVSDQVFAYRKKQEHVQPGKSETKPDVLAANNDVKNKQVTGQTNGQGYMQRDNKELKSQQYNTSEVMKKNYNEYMSKCTFSINDLQIAVFEGDIKALPADCVVIYSNEKFEEVKDGKGLYVHVCSENNRQACTLCAKRGVLKLCGDKKVLHVLGQALSMEDLKDAIEMCLEEATRLNCSSVSMPVMISGAEDVSRDVLVKSYIQALTNFSKQKKGPFHVNIVDIDPTKVAHLADVFISEDSRSHAKKNENEDPSGSKIPTVHEIEFLGKTGKVKIFSVLGNIEAVQVAAVVSTEDKSISGKSKIARALLKLGNDRYKQEHATLSKESHNAKIGSVFETKVMNEGQLTCQYVFHTVSPRRNRGYCKDTSSFQQDIHHTVTQILDKATRLRCNSLALPLIGTSEHEEEYPTPIPTCCEAMYKGITEYLQGHDTTLNRIDVVSPAECVVQVFREQMKTNVCVTI